MAGGEVSPVGRTRTAPAPGSDAARAGFAFASCQHYEHGYYTAYRHMAEEDLDLVVLLGDYIYEYGPNADARPSGVARAPRRGRADHARATTATATPSTRRTPTCRPPTRASRGSSPGTTTRSRTTTPADDPAGRRRRRPRRSSPAGPPPTRPTTSTCRCAAARCRAAPTCASTAASPTAAWREFNVLDTRQYRADQAAARRTARAALARDRRCSAPRRSAGCWTAWPARTRAGTCSPSRSSSPGATARRGPSASPARCLGRLPGRARQRLTPRDARRTANPVVLTGDVHSNWANHVMDDYARPARRRWWPPSSWAPRSAVAATARTSARTWPPCSPTTRT